MTELRCARRFHIRSAPRVEPARTALRGALQSHARAWHHRCIPSSLYREELTMTKRNGHSRKPNILFIMADDIGWSNIGAYHRGILASRTPNLDRLAAEGIMFTDYYAEASCTAGRANFVTGQLPIRTGLTTVGQAGAHMGMPDKAPTIAHALKAQGYATAQFGKNHFGDRNEYLPTVHGFDEFWGYLYHLDGMEDPFHPNYPKDLIDKVGPRNVLHCLAIDKDDATEHPRWGRVGKQKVIDEGPLPPHPVAGIKLNMETVDEAIRDRATAWMAKQVSAGTPFFCYLNPSRMHVVTHLSEKYQRMRTAENGWTVSEAGMAQLDDIVGSVMKKLDDLGVAENTIVVFTTDNGAENFTWPDGGQTPFAGGKGTVLEGGFRVPCIARWPGHIPPGKVENGIMSGLDWFPTLCAAAGDAHVVDELKKGKRFGDRTYSTHLDGYNQLDFICGRGPSNRHEVVYFAEGTFGAIRLDDYKFRFIDQPGGWLGGTVKPDWPIVVNLRLDPNERTGLSGSFEYTSWMKFHLWRFVLVQDVVAKIAQSFVEFPPLQAPASFNMDAVKEQVKRAAVSAPGK
jgi:arylsulfatase